MHARRAQDCLENNLVHDALTYRKTGGSVYWTCDNTARTLTDEYAGEQGRLKILVFVSVLI